jgi:hypothetical protein
VSRVSLIVPCHDLGRPLEEAVDSIFAQTWSDFEILVVDDGSTDPETRRLLRGFDWPKARVLSLPRRQPGLALGLGLEQAQGTFVGVLDPRHRLAPRYLEAAVAALEADAELDVVTCALQPIEDPGEPLRPAGLAWPDLLIACSVGPAALVRREALRACGGFDHSFTSSHDALWDLWIRLAEAGRRSHVLSEALVCVGLDGDAADEEARWAAARRLIEKHRDSYTRHLPEVLAGKEAFLRELAARNQARVRRPADARPGAVPPPAAPAVTVTAAVAPEPPPPVPPTVPPPLPDWEARDRLAVLEEALASARHEIVALRGSISWRLTAPLRAVHAWLTRGRSGS